MPRIVLDPGHGGGRTAGGSSALGVRGPAGTLEKDVTLALARHVAAILGGDIALTRTGDENPTLAARARAARDARAGVFLSLHANRGAHGARGSELWVHPRSGARSIALGRQLLRAMGTLGVPDHGIKAADMGVLRPEHLAPGTAACLLEVDFLSHPEGERRLRDPASLARLGRAIAGGVRAFLATGRGLDDPSDPSAPSDSSDPSAPTEEMTATPPPGPGPTSVEDIPFGIEGEKPPFTRVAHLETNDHGSTMVFDCLGTEKSATMGSIDDATPDHAPDGYRRFRGTVPTPVAFMTYILLHAFGKWGKSQGCEASFGLDGKWWLGKLAIHNDSSVNGPLPWDHPGIDTYEEFPSRPHFTH